MIGGQLLWRLRRKCLAIAESCRYALVRPRRRQSFFVVTCERNAGAFALRCLVSVYRQRYAKDAVRHLFIDDASNDGTHQLILDWLASHPDHTVDYRHNPVRVGGTENTLAGIRSAPEDAIVVELNGDDWLPDTGVLSYLNRVYADPAVWMTYNSARLAAGPPASWARPYSAAVVHANAFREQEEWTASHLHSFRRKLFDHLNGDSFIDPQTGQFWECADDQALYLALLELCGEHARHLDRITYVYNFRDASHSFQNAARSVSVAARVRRSKGYLPLARLE